MKTQNKSMIAGLCLIAAAVVAVISISVTGFFGNAPSGNIIGPDLSDIYAKFTCTACNGKSIAESDSITALGMREYIQQLSARGFSGNALFIEALKKFGLYSLSDSELRKSMKEMFNHSPPEDRPVISVSPMEVNLGNTTQAAGVILTMFIVKNMGKSDLIITDLKTSCSCLVASFVVDDRESPRLGRFSHSSGWSVTIKPGESARLWVYYDPRVNGWFTGHATRWVFITSNDPLNPVIQIKVEHYQVDTLDVNP